MNKIIQVIAIAATIALITSPFTSTLAQAHSHHVKCDGVNNCKGKSTCKTATHACKEKNSCKGKCDAKKSAKKCKKMGTTQQPSASS